jgi:hypothetical protein
MAGLVGLGAMAGVTTGVPTVMISGGRGVAVAVCAAAAAGGIGGGRRVASCATPDASCAAREVCRARKTRIGMLAATIAATPNARQ